ncbi:transcriptional regulator, partial [Streptomyces scabiei]|nr:transcriptional regulator [Streptomyces scabiei]
ADVRLILDTDPCGALGRGELGLREAVRRGLVEVVGEGASAKELREV